MSRYKPGSRVQKMWEVWEAKGTEAATAFGPSLNLAPSTIKAWCRMWEREKEGGGPKPKEPKAAKVTGPVNHEFPPKAKLPRITAEEKADAKAKSNCHVVWSTRPVRLIHHGDEQCEVRWLDTGSIQAIPTDQIRLLK